MRHVVVANLQGRVAALDVDRQGSIRRKWASRELRRPGLGFELIVHCNIFDRSNELATEAVQQVRASEADVSIVVWAGVGFWRSLMRLDVD